MPELKLQSKLEQGRFKISYYMEPDVPSVQSKIQTLLEEKNLNANVIFSFGRYIDIVPIRASKGLALRYFSDQWDIPLS
ncbi:MAG: HAD family hydrolase, partial [Magnetococcales bacterium]|nr:HAD family hydrolase [Magnetococcales bacterium]